MQNHDRLRLGRDLPLEIVAGEIQIIQRGYVDKYRLCPGIQHCVGRGHEAQRRHQHLVIRFDIQRLYGQVQSRRPAGDRDGVLGSHETPKIPLQPLHGLAHGEPLAFYHPVDGFALAVVKIKIR